MFHTHKAHCTWRLLLGAILAAVAFSAAGQIYRSVGPDGKTVFSDRPPADGKGVLLQAAPAPAPAAAPALAASGAAGEASAAASPKPAQADAPDADAMARALGALTNKQEAVQAFEQVCNEAQPGSAKRYSGAADQWRTRHAAVMARRDAILRAGAPATRRAIQESARAEARRSMGPVLSAAKPEKIQWCDRSVQEVLAGKSDLLHDPALAPLLAPR